MPGQENRKPTMVGCAAVVETIIQFQVNPITWLITCCHIEQYPRYIAFDTDQVAPKNLPFGNNHYSYSLDFHHHRNPNSLENYSLAHLLDANDGYPFRGPLLVPKPPCDCAHTCSRFHSPTFPPLRSFERDYFE